MPKIALYGFGSFPVIYRHLIDLARNETSPIRWCVVLTTPHYRKIIKEALPREEILDIYRELPRIPVGGDPSALAGYRGSLVEDIAAIKIARRKWTGAWLQRRAMDFYSLYRRFLIERQATHLLMSGIETPDAKTIVAVAQELGIAVIAPAHMRNLGGTYFSTDSHETPPAYAAADAAMRRRAAEFVHSFRARPVRPQYHSAEDAVREGDLELLEQYLPPLHKRIVSFLRIALERPDLFDHDMIRVSVMRTFGWVRVPIRGLRHWRNAAQYDIAGLDAVPPRFIFYPLQYTPESSINVPAPYFVDQLRAIDALRFAMPSDCTLLVKEHPACVEMRRVGFMRHVRNLPGVMVAKSTIPSIDLIRHALVTVSVTGTAVLEAFLLGRPALALGAALPSWVTAAQAHLHSLRSNLAAAIAQPPSEEEIIDRIAKLMSVRYPFYYGTAHSPGEPMLRRDNMRRFWMALNDHLDRERSAQSQAAARSDPAELAAAALLRNNMALHS
jgi:hypothetical protein